MARFKRVRVRNAVTIGMGVMIGALLMYLLDPERGRTRRVRISDQAAARGRDISESVGKVAEHQKGRARGVVHDVSTAFRTEQEHDDQTLVQKVRSEVLGYWDDSDIEVNITDGMVKVSGTVPDASSRDRLLSLIRNVEGVDLVEDRLKVA